MDREIREALEREDARRYDDWYREVYEESYLDDVEDVEDDDSHNGDFDEEEFSFRND